MSSTLTTPAPPTTAGPVTLRGVAASEWTKLLTLRSTWWTTAAAVVFIVGLGVLVAFESAATSGESIDPADFASGSLIGTIFAQLALGVLATMMITGEYGTGMIRSSMTAVPHRLPVLWAKAAVYTAFVLPVTFVASVVTIVLTRVIAATGSDDVPSLFDPVVLRVTIGAPLVLVVSGLVALGVGTLIRSTAGGVATLVGLFFVVPIVGTALPSSLHGFLPYLPSNAGASLTGLSIASGSEDLLAPWTGFAVLCGWAVVVLAAAAWRLRRSDV